MYLYSTTLFPVTLQPELSKNTQMIQRRMFIVVRCNKVKYGLTRLDDWGPSRWVTSGVADAGPGWLILQRWVALQLDHLLDSS